MPIKDGDVIKVDYQGTFDDGTIFDCSEMHGKPLEFEIGAKQVIKGFEDAVKGMEKGQEKNIKLNPPEAYGDYDPQLVKKIPKDKIPPGQEIKSGMILGVALANGTQIPAKVVEVTEKSVSIDLNHPLAGKTLNFKVKIVDINFLN
jgi:FKBP-type peptidyl-prolyl cis-trans isomerase 2